METFFFNFASRPFAYERLAKSLSRSVSSFSSFMREYLEHVAKAEQCAQHVDDFGIAANSAKDLTWNIRGFFECVHQARLKLTKEKIHFAIRQVEFLGRSISPKEILPPNQNILWKLIFSKSKNAKQRYMAFWNYYGNNIPRLAKKLNSFYKLLKAETRINNTSELRKTFDSVNKTLKRTTCLDD